MTEEIVENPLTGERLRILESTPEPPCDYRRLLEGYLDSPAGLTRR